MPWTWTDRGVRTKNAYQPGMIYDPEEGYIPDPNRQQQPAAEPSTTQSPSEAAWRRLPPAPAPPTTPAERRDLLASSFGGAPAAGGAAGVARVAALPARAPQRSSRELIARLNALVASGLVDVNDLVDPVTRGIRADVLARADAIGPYTGPTPGGPAGAAVEAAATQGYETNNPAEMVAELAAAQEARAQRADIASQSGYFEDPRTGQLRVTASRGNELLQTFGTARAAEQRYRSELDRAAAEQANSYAQYAEQLARGTPAGQRLAQEAYNRARGAASTYAAEGRPIGVAQLGQGATPEQWEQYTQAVQQGYGPDEWEELARGGALPGRRTARSAPATTYFQALRARGY